jgi:hypothetical protein
MIWLKMVGHKIGLVQERFDVTASVAQPSSILDATTAQG